MLLCELQGRTYGKTRLTKDERKYIVVTTGTTTTSTLDHVAGETVRRTENSSSTLYDPSEDLPSGVSRRFSGASVSIVSSGGAKEGNGTVSLSESLPEKTCPAASVYSLAKIASHGSASSFGSQ